MRQSKDKVWCDDTNKMSKHAIRHVETKRDAKTTTKTKLAPTRRQRTTNKRLHKAQWAATGSNYTNQHTIRHKIQWQQQHYRDKQDAKIIITCNKTQRDNTTQETVIQTKMPQHANTYSETRRRTGDEMWRNDGETRCNEPNQCAIERKKRHDETKWGTRRNTRHKWDTRLVTKSYKCSSCILKSSITCLLK